MNVPVASLITQVIVDEHDPAFQDPSKPIGSHFSKEEAEVMMANGYVMKEDAGRGWRRVVASPKPLDVVEKETVRAMVQAGQLAIAVGGGGIPVYRQGNHLKGASAVVDKDPVSYTHLDVYKRQAPASAQNEIMLAVSRTVSPCAICDLPSSRSCCVRPSRFSACLLYTSRCV